MNLNPKDTMKSGRRDQAEGTVKEAKDRAKEAGAKAIGAPGQHVEGAPDRIAGKVQKKTGQIKLDRMRE